jgi:hypothetical protein
MPVPVARFARPRGASVDTVPVAVTVLQVRRADEGRLMALAEVELEIAGVAIVLTASGLSAPGRRTRSAWRRRLV